jgi:hypothetical protein
VTGIPTTTPEPGGCAVKLLMVGIVWLGTICCGGGGGGGNVVTRFVACFLVAVMGVSSVVVALVAVGVVTGGGSVRVRAVMAMSAQL